MQDALPFMKENDEVQVVLYGDEALGVELPAAVELVIASSEPGVKGDTSSGSVTKPAKLETGLEIKVPLFIKEGEKVKVSTETGEFAGRA